MVVDVAEATPWGAKAVLGDATPQHTGTPDPLRFPFDDTAAVGRWFRVKLSRVAIVLRA
jgi:hypothetical protein